VVSSDEMATYHFSVVIEKDEDGYFGDCPPLQSCYTQAETYEEVLVEDRVAAGDEIPQPESVSLTSLDVAV
jgi:predicted RNase H-like HicB family nuclease